jgi:phosphatidylinositol alpha-1,6-mannosyltransferase
VRALIVSPDFPPAPGGIQLTVQRLAANMRAFEPRVVTLGVTGAASAGDDGLDVRRVASKGASNKLANVALNAVALGDGLRRRPDVVISAHVVAWPAAAALRRLRGVPAIQYLHADEARKRPGLTRRAVAGADAVVAVSSHARGLALDAGAEPERVHTIHPGVDPAPERAGSPEGPPTILTVARMEEAYKGHDSLARALPRVRERVPGARWVVVGDGRLRPEIERLAAAAGVADAVEFLGAVGDRERDEWLGRADVFALPSRLPEGGAGGEGFGIVYLEASAHGLPVVACATAGALDAVADGETGVLVEPGDDAALADAIAGLLADPARARRLGEAGRRRAREEFTWERPAGRVEELAERLVASR